MLHRLLDLSRYLQVLAILGCLLLTVSVVLMGVGLIVAQEWELLANGEVSPKASKQLTLAVIQTIDMFLVGAISYIIAVGLYKLFIATEEEQLIPRIKIRNLADLENKIIGVVVVALAIGFLGRAEESMDPQAILFGGLGVAVVMGALCLFLRFSGPAEQ